jgi:predicted transcriptional regulator
MGKPAFPRRTSRYFIVALVLASMLLAVTPAVTAEDVPPEITVTIDEADRFQSTDVSISQRIVVVEGEVKVTKDNLLPETIRVTVQGTPWDDTVTDVSEQVSGTDPKPFGFTFRMTIPMGETEGVYSGQVAAVWTSSTGDIRVEETDDFQVRVVNTPFTIDVNPVYLVADAGTTKYVTITIEDRSLTGLTYIVSTGELTSPEPGDWLRWARAWLDTDRLEITGGGTDVVTLEIEVPKNASDTTMQVPITVMVEDRPEYSRTQVVTVQVQGVPIEPPITPDPEVWWRDPMVLFTVGMLIIVVGFIGFFGFTEVGILLILWGLLMPLFTRLKRDEVLNQFTRGEIFGFIKANPGIHLTAIKENLGLANGVLAYHLKVLIREEFVVARNEGGYKRFYPRDMRVPRKRVHFTRLQLDIVEKLTLHPGSTQASLARMLGESKQVINYNVGVLVAAGVVRVEREGSKTLLYIEDSSTFRPQVMVAELVEEGTDEDEKPRKAASSPVRLQ